MKKLFIIVCLFALMLFVSGCGIVTGSGTFNPKDDIKTYFEFLKSDKCSYKAHFEIQSDGNIMLVNIYVDGNNMKVELENGDDKTVNYVSYDDEKINVYNQSGDEWSISSVDRDLASENYSMLLLLSSFASFELMDFKVEDFTYNSENGMYSLNNDSFSSYYITDLEFFISDLSQYHSEFHFKINGLNAMMQTSEPNNVKVELPL